MKLLRRASSRGKVQPEHSLINWVRTERYDLVYAYCNLYKVNSDVLRDCYFMAIQQDNMEAAEYLMNLCIKG